jgi:hypothetical protein
MAIIDTARETKRDNKLMYLIARIVPSRKPESAVRQLMSAFVRITDSSQTLRHVRYVPFPRMK